MADRTMTDIALLPCPFCGGEASPDGTVRYGESHAKEQGWNQTEFYYCNCMQCGANNKGIIGHKTRASAIAAWNRRSSPSQVAPQPQAGEPVKVYEPYPGAFDSILGPASPQPANPAQVTDERLIAVARDAYRSSLPHYTSDECFAAVVKAVTAAIGAGGQAVANDAGAKLAKAMWGVDLVSPALPQPHPADERVVEALREALAKVAYVPGDHPIVPVKHDAFLKTIQKIVDDATKEGR